VTVRFRGRELTHPELGRNLISRFADRVKDHGIPERTPLLEGKSMHITMASTHKPKGHDGPARAGDGAEAREAPTAPAPTVTPVAAVTPPTEAVVIQPATASPARTAAPARAAASKSAAATPKTTSDKTPAPEPVRTGE
jgi:hypothetical protein